MWHVPIGPIPRTDVWSTNYQPREVSVKIIDFVMSKILEFYNNEYNLNACFSLFNWWLKEASCNLKSTLFHVYKPGHSYVWQLLWNSLNKI